MHLLLGSGGFRDPQKREQLLIASNELYAGIPEVLFIPWAIANYDEYEKMMNEFMADCTFTFKSIHHYKDPIDAIQNADAINVGGGNSFLLAKTFHEMNALQALRDQVANGKPYKGVSAGSNIACPTIQTTNDMPIVMPPSFEALGLVPFQINPHYYPGQVFYKEDEESDQVFSHYGESRARRIKEYHEHNQLKVIGLYEGSYLTIQDSAIGLHGDDAVYLEPDGTQTRYKPGDALDWLLE